MKEYTVIWIGAAADYSIEHTIEAENNRDAFNKIVAKHTYTSHPKIRVYAGIGLFDTEAYDNPHYVEPQKVVVKKVKESHSQQPTGSGGSAEWHESLGAAAKNIRNQVSPPESSGWAILYRVCGCIILLAGFIGTIGIAQKNEEAGFQFAIVAITLTLSSFLAAFLIDVLTDMRHYLKRIAEKE